MPNAKIKKYFNKKGYKKYSNLRKDVFYLKKKVSKIHNEYKYIGTDNAISLTSDSIVHLTPIAQGDGVSDRSGNRVSLQSIHIRGILQGGAVGGTATQPQPIRLMLVLAKSWDSTSNIAVSDLLDSSSYESFRDLEQDTKNFKVLMDKSYIVYGTYNNPSFAKLVNINRKVNIPCEFDGGATNQMKRNQLFLVAIADNTGATGTFNYQSRIRFTDA